MTTDSKLDPFGIEAAKTAATGDMPAGLPGLPGMPVKKEEQRVVINFEDYAPDLMPEGMYEARVFGAEMGTSRAGNAMLTVDFIIMGDSQYAGRILKYWLALTSSQGWKINAFFKEVCGINPEGQFSFLPSELVNHVCMVNVEHSEYRGQTRESIADVVAHDKGVHKYTGGDSNMPAIPASNEDLPY